jgi:hypothetical protein
VRLLPDRSQAVRNRGRRAAFRTLQDEERKKTNVQKIGFATLTASAFAAGLVGLAAPAMAAPSGVTDAEETISSLEAEGYDVIVNHLSEAPLAQADVVSVGRGQTFMHSVSNANNDDDKLYGPVPRNTVYVNVK